MNAHDYRLNPNINEEWISCKNCRGWMMPLDKYEVEDGVWETPDGSGCAPGGS